MGAPRGEFSSKMGFLLAAAGSAVGLGNIVAFPAQVASNGGAAFLLVYLGMAFCLAYPALMAELIIGRHTKANSVKAMRSIRPMETVGIPSPSCTKEPISASLPESPMSSSYR